MILYSNLLSAIFPILILLSYAHIPGLISLAWSSLFAAAFFICMIFYNSNWAELKNKILWKNIFPIIFFTGLLYYSFYYLGLTKTTPGNASLIALLEILTSYIFFHTLRKEYMPNEHRVGALLMLTGAVIILSRNFYSFNIGDFFVVLATIVAPIGNFFQRKVRETVPTENILFLRNLISAPFIFLLAYNISHNVTFGFTRESVLLLATNGILILGVAKYFWIESIHRISVTKANAIGAVGPLITLILALFILKQVPTVFQLFSVIPLFFGALLLTDNLKFKSKP